MDYCWKWWEKREVLVIFLNCLTLSCLLGRQSFGRRIGLKNLLIFITAFEKKKVEKIFVFFLHFICLVRFFFYYNPRIGRINFLSVVSPTLNLYVWCAAKAPEVPLVSQQGSYIAIVLTHETRKRRFQGPLSARWIVPKIFWRAQSNNY